MEKATSDPPRSAGAPGCDWRALGPRRQREYHTVQAMIAMHCRDRHGRQVDDCADCQELRAYAALRLSRCVFKEGKPTCQKCPVHCYRPDMRAKITAVMRHAGPRMLLEHPYWALRHLLDGWSPTPEAPRRRETSRLDGG